MAQTFTNIVAVLMRDPGFKNLRLAELEWLVIPAIMSGQWRVAQARAEPPQDQPEEGADKKKQPFMPVATALWASVSAEIDQRLSTNLDKPLRLAANEWASGKHLWLIAIAGDRRALPKFIDSLTKTDFEGRPVKMRVTGTDGQVEIRTLGAKI